MDLALSLYIIFDQEAYNAVCHLQCIEKRFLVQQHCRLFLARLLEQFAELSVIAWEASRSRLGFERRLDICSSILLKKKKC